MPPRELCELCLMILASWTVAIGITLLNKWLLSYEKSFEDLPVTILWLQSLTGTAISAVFIVCQRYWSHETKINSLTWILNSVKLKETIILAVLSIVSLLFNTVILKFYSVALFTISRTLTTVVTVVFSRFLLNEATPPVVVMACTLISIGYLISISTNQLTSALQIQNVICSIIAGISGALSFIYVKLAVPEKQHSVLVVVFINNCIYSVFFFVIMIAVGELKPFINSHSSWSTIGEVVLSGALGFSVFYLASILVQTTSPVTYQIIAAVRLILQVIIGLFVFKEPLTQVKVFATCLVFTGSLLYGLYKAAGVGKDSLELNKNIPIKPLNNVIANKRLIV